MIMISTPKTHLRHTDTKPGAQDQAPAIATAGNRGPVSRPQQPAGFIRRCQHTSTALPIPP